MSSQEHNMAVLGQIVKHIPAKLMGISKKSGGWIFSVWAKRPMQEDLSVAT